MSKIVLIGDVMLDISVSGSVTRIAPEAPIPIIREITRKEVLGGAGNVYENMLGAGENPYFITVVGNDIEAEKISSKITNGYAYKDSFRETTTKTRIYAYTSHIRKEILISRIDKETTSKFERFENLFTEDACKEIKEASYIVFSDYNKGLISKDLIEYLKNINPTAKYIGDTKNLTNVYCNFYIVTPNEFEIQKDTKSHEDVLLLYRNSYNISRCRRCFCGISG
jgi:D-beta-D-heptose 7-phosphate kinase/D-beta-D-heptose 1-phosphate adenosyltransferase